MADERSQAIFHFHGFRLDVGRDQLFDRSGAVLQLSSRSFDLLRYFLENPNRIISRDELMQAVWPSMFVADDTITRSVAEIRRALGSEGARLLRTVPKRGYTFAAEASDPPAKGLNGTKVPFESHQVPFGPVAGDQGTTEGPHMERRLAAILSADIAGYSRLIGFDEAGTFRRVKALRTEVLEPLVARHGGRIVSYAGDGALAEFPSVVRAVECALAIQRTVAEREANMSPNQRIALRIGIRSGDIIADGTNDLCGDTVNIAARLEQLAQPGGICLSDRAYEEIAGRVEAVFHYGGEPPLKNIGRGVGV